MKESTLVVVHYIQQSLYDGKQPDETGVYSYTRGELAENAGISTVTINRCKTEICHFLKSKFDLCDWAKYEEYRGEQLFLDVSYEKGFLKFKRNPLTEKPELSFLWGLPPSDKVFVYDSFDEKHRRRCNSSNMVFDKIPWSWNADDYEEELKLARIAIAEHQARGKGNQDH